MAGPSAWQRVEELVRRLMEVYGAGLERTLGHARAAASDVGELEARLEDDDLVSSLLLLHGLHPAPAGDRVRRAVERAAPRLGLASAELVRLDQDGVAWLRVTTSEGSCSSSPDVVQRALAHVVAEAAPEVTRVELEGLARPEPASPLVQLGRRVGGGRGRP